MSDSIRRTPCPRWDRDFPIRQNEDSYTTRREFTKFLGLTSLAFFLGTLWEVVRSRFVSSPQSAAPMAVVKDGEMKIGGYRLFRFPDGEHGEPCILVRLNEETYAAYSQSCTHLACPVHFNAERKQLVCPCHNGSFSAEDGRVLAGPPKRPLPRFRVVKRDGQVWVEGPEISA